MRMLVSIVVNLYTVRILWKVLGIVDYGIYNLVGGIVLMFAFLNTAMVASSQRFISFELGKGDSERLRKTFAISVTVHMLLALVILVLAETIGLWFLNVKLNIPADRMVASNWVYQCSILAFLLNVVSVPYNACIVAHEHMKIYGYFGILDVFLKLGIVLLTSIIQYDHLIVYAILILCVSAFMRLLYGLYCKKKFDECKFQRHKDSEQMKDMFAFAGWSFLGNMGFSVRDQGTNIILNLFFNVTVNAAKGIANQIGHVINGFATNFTMAMNPQITKRYAMGEIDSMLQLVYNGCRVALLLMSVVVIPIFVSAETLMTLWLGTVAPYTIGFLRLVLIMSLIDCVVSPITTSLQATGKIKKFQIVISLIMTANLPISWLLLKLYINPYIVMFVAIGTSIAALISRLVLLHELIDISYRKFYINVYLRTIPCILAAGVTSWCLYRLFSPDLLGLIGFAILSIAITMGLIYCVVLSSKERALILSQITKKIII